MATLGLGGAPNPQPPLLERDTVCTVETAGGCLKSLGPDLLLGTSPRQANATSRQAGTRKPGRSFTRSSPHQVSLGRCVPRQTTRVLPREHASRERNGAPASTTTCGLHRGTEQRPRQGQRRAATCAELCGCSSVGGSKAGQPGWGRGQGP